MLLTTCEVTNFEQAIEKLAWYTLRWGIEVYHRYITKEPAPPANPPSLAPGHPEGGQSWRPSWAEMRWQTGYQESPLGLQRLDDRTAMWKVLTGKFEPHIQEPTVSSTPGYG